MQHETTKTLKQSTILPTPNFCTKVGKGLCTLSPTFSYTFFHIHYPKISSRTETLHTESKAY